MRMPISNQHFWVRRIFWRCKINYVRHTYLFNFYLSKIICKRPEVIKEPTHFLTMINNGKAFPRFDGMVCSYCALTISTSWGWRGANFFGQNIYGEVVLNGRTNNHIMPRWERSSINDKCVFQESEHCKSSLEGSIKLWKDLSSKLIVKRFQKLHHVQFPFPIVDSFLGYLYIIWKVNTKNRRMNLKNTLSTMHLGGGISCKAWIGLEASE